MTGVTLRRNILEDVTFSGGLVKRGDLVTYSFADVHLNPEVYSQPEEFDPSSNLVGLLKGDRKIRRAHSYISAGVLFS